MVTFDATYEANRVRDLPPPPPLETVGARVPYRTCGCQCHENEPAPRSREPAFLRGMMAGALTAFSIVGIVFAIVNLNADVGAMPRARAEDNVHRTADTSAAPLCGADPFWSTLQWVDAGSRGFTLGSSGTTFYLTP